MTSFSTDLALALARSSLNAYDPAPCAYSTVITEGSFQAVVTVVPGVVEIAFRGTADLANMLSDAEIVQIGQIWLPAGARLHRGFANALGCLWPRLLEALPTDMANRSLILTGHSLGAAMAILAAALFLSNRGLRATHVYAFGAPRVGNRQFCRWYDEFLGPVTWRVCHCDDLVALVPFCLGAYREAGQHAALLASPDRVVLNPSLRYEACRTLQAFSRDISRRLGILYGHSCERYVSNLQRVVDNERQLK